jgi:hypothetical protein
MCMKISLKILLFSILIIDTPVAFSQAKTANLPDSLKKSESDHSLFTGVGYGSNMMYLGSTISKSQPYGYASLIYGFRDQLYISVTTVHIANNNLLFPLNIGSFTYNHTFNSWFDISAGIYGYHIASSISDTLLSSFLYSDLTLGFDWKLLYTRISAGTMISSSNKTYFQVKNSRFFQTPEFSHGKYNFSFDPYFNMIFGPLTKAESSGSTVITITPPFRNKGKGNSSSAGTKYSTTYGAMEIDFGIPVSFNASRLTIEAEPGYNYLFYSISNYPAMKGFVFSLSGTFRIF